MWDARPCVHVRVDAWGACRLEEGERVYERCTDAGSALTRWLLGLSHHLGIHALDTSQAIAPCCASEGIAASLTLCAVLTPVAPRVSWLSSGRPVFPGQYRLPWAPCAYGLPYMKPTDIWTNLFEWVPMGSTGDGRCHSRCGHGGWRIGEDGKLRFRHYVALARDPADGLRGAGSRQHLNSIPTSLMKELLQHVKPPRAGARQPVIIDLCAGYGSIGPVARELGFQYIPVDLENRKTPGF